MAKKTEFSYEDGDFVVYPTHGVGRIIGSEVSTVAGMEMTLLVIRFEQERMTLRCLLYTSPSPRDYAASRMPSSA